MSKMLECIVCLRTFQSEPCKDPEYFTCVFNAFCSHLNIHLTDNLQWNFEQEDFPFCQVCYLAVNRLKGLDDQLNVIQKEISQILKLTKDEILKSGCTRIITTDIDRVTYIRQEALRDNEIRENPVKHNEDTPTQDDTPLLFKVEIEEEGNNENTSSSDEHFDCEFDVQEQIEVFDSLDEAINDANETNCINDSIFSAPTVTTEVVTLLMPPEADEASTESSRGRAYIDIDAVLDAEDLKIQGKLQCDVCGKIFENTSKFKYHQKNHLKGKPYKCDICEKSFSVKTRLASHKQTHSEERPFKCDTYDKCYNRRQHLDDHKRLHTGEKPYKCLKCGVGFSRSANLNEHKKVHSSIRPYQCEECAKDFKRKCDLEKHVVTHSTGEKPFKCEVCNRGFWRPYELNSHRRKLTCKESIKI